MVNLNPLHLVVSYFISVQQTSQSSMEVNR